MEETRMICILCPLGCHLTARREGDAVTVVGNACKRGEAYGIQEMTAPVRVVTASMRVDGAEWPVCPVKTEGEVPKAKIGEVLGEIRKTRLHAPVRMGDVVIGDVCGTGVNVVATAHREPTRT